MADADLFWEKSTTGWLLMTGLFWEKYRWLVADKPKQGDCLKGFQGMKKIYFSESIGGKKPT
jgi:hypothetical protein